MAALARDEGPRNDPRQDVSRGIDPADPSNALNTSARPHNDDPVSDIIRGAQAQRAREARATEVQEEYGLAGKAVHSVARGVGDLSLATRSFLAGVIDPVRSIFKSPKHVALGAGITIGFGIVTAATSGATVPWLVAAGLGVGAIDGIRFVQNFRKADSPEERSESFKYAGRAATSLACVGLAAKNGFGVFALLVEQSGMLTKLLKDSKSPANIEPKVEK